MGCFRTAQVRIKTGICALSSQTGLLLCGHESQLVRLPSCVQTAVVCSNYLQHSALVRVEPPLSGRSCCSRRNLRDRAAQADPAPPRQSVRQGKHTARKRRDRNQPKPLCPSEGKQIGFEHKAPHCSSDPALLSSVSGFLGAGLQDSVKIVCLQTEKLPWGFSESCFLKKKKQREVPAGTFASHSHMSGGLARPF